MARFVKNIAVIFWSGTGNTEMMAQAIAEGADADLFSVDDFSGSIAHFDKIAFGCPAMGDEILEPDEFETFFSRVEKELGGKIVALFGSYDWGNGEWMKKWVRRVREDGAQVFCDEGLIIRRTPDDDDLEKCRRFGSEFADLH